MQKDFRMSIPEFIYVCYLVLMLFAKGIGLYDGQLLYKLFLVGALGLIAIKMLVTEYSIKEWIVMIVTCLLITVVYLNCKEKGIVICSLTILGMKGVSTKRLLKIGMWTWGITMFGNIVFHLINLDSSGYKVHEKLGLGHIFRWDLGFSHPNVLHISYLIVSAFIIYNLDKKYNFKHVIWLLAGNIFIFIYSVSYTGILISTIYILASWYINIRGDLNRLEYFLLEMVYPACILLSMFSPILLPESIFDTVNKIFSNRLILSKYYLTPEYIKLLGNNLEKITSSVMTMDNSYVFTLIIYGVVIFLIIVMLYLVLIRNCVKEKKKKELMMIACFMIAGITEPFLFNTSFKNITLLFLGDYLWNCRAGVLKGEKKFVLLPIKINEVAWDITKITEFKENIVFVWKNKYKKLLIFALGLGLISGVLCGMNKQMPDGYIVPRKHVDIESDETWYLDSANDSQYEKYKIMDYVDKETRMQILEGNIVTVEKVRSCISSICLTAFVVMGFGIMYNVYLEQKKNDKR